MTDESQEYASDAFLSDIKTAINVITVDKLKHNILSFASGMPVDKRLEFFQAIAFEDIDEMNESEVDFDDDLQLIDDVESFYKKISMGFYDHSLDIENPKELPAWVDDMDVLFSRTNDAFINAEYSKAARAYSFLFSALHVAEDIAVEHQLYSAQDIVITDITAAKSSYLRSAFEITEFESRPAEIYDILQENLALGESRCGLTLINDSFPFSDEELEDFLPEWLKYLKQHAVNEPDFESLRLWLVREALFLLQGVEGMEQEAEQHGAKHPELFFDIVTHYLEDNDLLKAEETCMKGIKVVKAPHKRAVLADWLAEIAERDGDTLLALKYRHEAWRMEPDQRRLVTWCNTVHQAPDDGALQDEIDYLENIGGHGRLMAMLQALTGDYEAINKRLLNCDPLGWKSARHPGNFLLPFTLILIADLKSIPDHSQIKVIAEDMKGIFVRWSQEMDIDNNQDLHTYMDYLFPALERHPISEEMRITLTRSVHSVLLKRIRVISKDQLRYAYNRIAIQATAFVETAVISSREALAETFLSTVRSRILRNKTLRAELKVSMTYSKVISDDFTKGVSI
ncbi:hypothetical protein PQO03_09270 [Lentisphaera profundi]|uniref:Globin family profile domain-containing protein n=1 Tax=Lentisphaera profundi TaxID=1658616 RepID=A0ABY7VRP6_9BACT|nr:hypothetical protein [Lentisphaera profundi]WDE95905.1 hypothetical protein PQO03_09270 [Lentisphaera profundi]